MKMKTPPGPSVLKWSSKPADHNAARVRNNQRRHRARAKEHAQDLERRLEETSARLEAALQTITHLAQEVEILRGRVFATTPAPTWPPQLPPPTVATGPPAVAAHVEAEPVDPTPILDPERESGAPTTEIPETTAPPPPPPPPPAETSDNADCGCERLPPQAPGESTLPCSSAFRIIEQQNFSGVEVTTIRAWLGPGFRRPLRPGEACRVETNRVYELLDHITSSS